MNKGTGAVSFRYADDDAQGQVSINSSLTSFLEPVRMGFPNTCSVKDSCNLAAGEVCLFKVCYDSPSCRLNAGNLYSVDNSHIADCNIANVPFVNNFTKEVCCKFNEICSDGIDNDGDNYIDCADEDCKQTNTNLPKFCTNSPSTSDACILSTSTNGLGVTTVTYNQTCVGQQPLPVGTYPVVSPPTYVTGNLKPPVWYCSYGASDDSNQNTPGVCCQSGTYAVYDDIQEVWFCEDSEQCGLDPLVYPCEYDIDADFEQWMGSYYTGNAQDWCYSKFPNYYSEGIPYSPRRSTGCCLIAQNAEVDYYTAEENVKIFGYHKYCGDGIIDFDESEECDGNYLGTCEDYINSCPIGNVPTGTPLCDDDCQLQVGSPNCYCAPATGGNNNNNGD